MDQVISFCCKPAKDGNENGVVQNTMRLPEQCLKTTKVIVAWILKGTRTACTIFYENKWKTMIMEQKYSAGHTYPSKSLTFHQSESPSCNT